MNLFHCLLRFAAFRLYLCKCNFFKCTKSNGNDYATTRIGFPIVSLWFIISAGGGALLYYYVSFVFVGGSWGFFSL